MMVLGELGGIFGAIVSIPSLFISHFIQNLFMSSVTDLMPGKQKSDLYQESSIKDKIAEFQKQRETISLPAEDV